MPEDSIDYSDSTADWLETCRRRKKAAIEFWTDPWKRAEENYKFYYGDHWTKDEIRRADKAERTHVSFNDILVNTNNVTGREVTGRVMPVFRGRSKVGSSDQHIRDSAQAQAFTELVRWIRQNCEAEHVDSDAFLDLFVAGFSHTETVLDSRSGHDQKIVRRYCYPWDVATDPSFKEKNCKDKRYLFAFQWVPVDVVDYMFPGKGEAVAGAVKSANAEWEGGKPLATSDEQAIDRRMPSHGRWFDRHRNEVLIVTYQFLAIDDLYQFVGEDGEERLVTLPEFKAYQELLVGSGYDALREGRGYMRRRQDVVKQAFFTGETVLQEPQPAAVNAFSFESMTCYTKRSPNGTEPFGPIDVSRDPARWKDRFMSLNLDTFAVSPKAPVFREADAYENEEEAKANIAKPMGDVVLKKGTLDKNKPGIMIGPSPRFPAIPSELHSMAESQIARSMGSSPWSTGQVEDVRRAPFQSVDAVQKAAFSNYAYPFDALKLHRKRTARLDLLMAAEYLSPKTILDAIGREHFLNLPAPEGLDRAAIDQLQQQLFQAKQMKAQDPQAAEVEVELQKEIESVYLQATRFGKGFERAWKFDISFDEQPMSPTQAHDLIRILPQMLEALQGAQLQMPPEFVIWLFENAGWPNDLTDQWRQHLAIANQQAQGGNGAVQNQQKVIEQFVSTLPEDVRVLIEQVQAAQQQGAQA